MQEIPLTNDARSTFRTTLGGQNVRLRLWWQPTDAHWYLSLAWLDGRGIVSGVRLVAGGNALRGIVSDFVGSITVTGEGGGPGRNAWGQTHRLVYAP